MYGKAAIEARALPPSLLTKLLRTENHPLQTLNFRTWRLDLATTCHLPQLEIYNFN